MYPYVEEYGAVENRYSRLDLAHVVISLSVPRITDIRRVTRTSTPLS